MILLRFEYMIAECFAIHHEKTNYRLKKKFYNNNNNSTKFFLKFGSNKNVTKKTCIALYLDL